MEGKNVKLGSMGQKQIIWKGLILENKIKQLKGGHILKRKMMKKEKHCLKGFGEKLTQERWKGVIGYRKAMKRA